MKQKQKKSNLPMKLCNQYAVVLCVGIVINSISRILKLPLDMIQEFLQKELKMQH